MQERMVTVVCAVILSIGKLVSFKLRMAGIPCRHFSVLEIITYQSQKGLGGGCLAYKKIKEMQKWEYFL